MAEIVQPRKTADRESKYMGLAWFYAGFSKDPSTQVGAQVVTEDNHPLGWGYNGPPRKMRDEDVIWSRPKKDKPDELSKYDLIVHAELNAMDHSNPNLLVGSVLYVTAMPCPTCMLEIARKEISRVVYFDFKTSQAQEGSMFKDQSWKKKTMEIARMSNVRLEPFNGNVAWVFDWANHLKQLGIFEV